LDNELFSRSAALLRKWGDTRLSSGGTLSGKLTIGKVSLWEVAAPFLALYRFPEFVLKTDTRRSPGKRFTEIVRPYRGLLGQARDVFLSAARRSSTDCISWPKTSPRVLFLSFWPLFYRETFQAVAEYLADNKAIATIALFNAEKFPAKPSRSLINFHHVYKHITPEVVSRTKEYKNYLRRMEDEFLQELQTVVQGDLPHAWPLVKREFKWLFRVLFPRLAREVAIAEHIMVEHYPEIVVSPDDADRARIYTILARALGIPSLIVQQGLLNEKAVEWRFCTADRVAAIGPSSIKALEEHGLVPGKIELTGGPRFDALCRPAVEQRDKIRASMGIRPEQQMVLLASQPCVYGAFSSPNTRTMMLRALGKTAASIRSVQLVVKAHPTEDLKELQHLIGNNDQVSFVERSEDIQKLVIACDVFVTFFSTSALQALVAGKPVVSLCFQGSGVTGPYVNSKAVFAARSEKELKDYLSVLTGPDRQRFLAEREDARKELVHELTYLSDGFAARRVADLIIKTLKK
jgi:spore coat polysaccharide biosynthesis predicted glycosyltransferase SpsG